jgi:hypothetical protein
MVHTVATLEKFPYIAIIDSGRSLRLVRTKEAIQETPGLRLCRRIQVLLRRLYEKGTLLIDKSGLFETHRHWVFQEGICFAVGIHDQYLTIKGAECSRLESEKKITPVSQSRGQESYDTPIFGRFYLISLESFSCHI